MRILILAILLSTSLFANQLALIQIQTEFKEFDKNYQALLLMAQDAVNEGANIILMPEGAVDGYGEISRGSYTDVWCKSGRREVNGRDCHDVEETLTNTGGSLHKQDWINFAINNQVHLIFGSPSRETDKNNEVVYRNTAFAISPQGEVKEYHKNRLFWTDTGYATRDTAGLIIDLPIGRFGLMICADVHYATNLFSEYQRQQVDGILAIGFGIAHWIFAGKLRSTTIPKAFYTDAWSSGYIDQQMNLESPISHYLNRNKYNSEAANGYSLFNLNGEVVLFKKLEELTRQKKLKGLRFKRSEPILQL